MTIRVGVVGVGHLGKEHARVYRELEGAQLVGVVDTDASRAALIGEQHGVPFSTDPAWLLPQIDAVSIVVPTPLHHEVALPFLAAGKAVLVEKPLAATVDQADALIATAERHGALLQVGHIERFNPVVAAACELVRDPIFIECDRIHPFSLRSTDVSVVLDLMIHDIDLVLHLAAAEVEELDALGAAVLSPTEDLATARILFNSGCVALVKTSRVAMNRSRKVRIFSERSYVSVDLVARAGMRIHLTGDYDPQAFLDPQGRLAAPEGEAAFLARHLHMEPLQIPAWEPLVAELKAFLEARRTGSPPQVSGWQGRQAMATAARIQERMAYHRERLQARRRT